MENNVLTVVSSETNDILTTFKQQSLIGPKDIEALKAAKDFAISSFADMPMYRPMIVKLSSVLSDGQFPTVDSKFWQCKAETEVQFNELVRLVYKIESVRVDLEEIDYKIKTLMNIINSEKVPDGVGDIELLKFECKRFLIKKESISFELKLMEKNLKYRIEEVSDWCTIASTLAKDCKHSIHNKNESMTETLFKALEYQISKAQDEAAKKSFVDQLNTLKKLLFQKAKQSI